MEESTNLQTGVPNPGSDEAIERGCICPVLDNRYGRGINFSGEYTVFVYTVGCPLHPAEGKALPDSENNV